MQLGREKIQMIKTFKHGNYFYRFKCKINGGYCWWKCDISDFDMHINDLKCIDFVIMDRQDFTRKQLLAEFDLKQAWRDELMSKKKIRLDEKINKIKEPF